jgi:hypothetical protein
MPTAQREPITLGLGETLEFTIKDSERLPGWKDTDCRFHITGNAVVTGDDLEGDKGITVVAAQIGRSLISYGPDKGAEMSPEQKFSGARPRELRNLSWEVTVVDKRKEAAAPDNPLASSSQFNGQIPMEEVQEEPSEKTPYGIGQEGKPVAPHPGMAPADGSTIARQSENATPTGPTTPETAEEK